MIFSPLLAKKIDFGLDRRGDSNRATTHSIAIRGGGGALSYDWCIDRLISASNTFRASVRLVGAAISFVSALSNLLHFATAESNFQFPSWNLRS